MQMGVGNLVDSRASWGSVHVCSSLSLGLWLAALPHGAHCIQSQTPHYRSKAAKLEAVQRRGGSMMGWGVGPGAHAGAVGKGEWVGAAQG